MSFLLERDALNGKSGSAFLSRDGENHELFSLKKIQSDAEFQEADFKVVAVSTDDSRLLAKAKSFAEGRGWGDEYTLLFDKNQDFMRAMNVPVVPHVFVVDPKGKIVFSHNSYVQGGEVELFEAVKKSAR
jgi:peroxiredoxin